MGHFTTIGKQYRDGAVMTSFVQTDSLITTPGNSIKLSAPAVLPGGDGAPRSFLFWDTGRRTTTKRTVQWTFNHPLDWSSWNAVAYYGSTGVGPGGVGATVDAHWAGVGAISPTPIDGGKSSFVNGPGGAPLAWPRAGDDHAIDTQFGASTLVALEHLRRSATEALLTFSSWQELVPGGDDTAAFDESDDGLIASEGITGVEHLTAQSVSLAKGASRALLATYVIPHTDVKGVWGNFRDILRGLEPHGPIPVGDPSPEDLVRLKLISESLDLVRGEKVTESDAFEGLLGAARRMNPAELRRAIASTRATLRRGAAALKSMESLTKRKR